MGPEELKEWKMRLQHAHNEWRNAGYIPDDRHGSSGRYAMARYLDAYRGDFPVSLSGATENADQMAGNLTFSIINTMLAQISGRHPDPVLAPIGAPAKGDDARRRAWLNERLIEFQVTEKKYKREMDMALMSAVLTGFGVVRHGFTPGEEYQDDRGRLIARHKNQTPDFPWIQFLRPWQIRIDPMVNDFAPDGEPRWVAFHNLYFASQVRKNPSLIFREDLVPTHYHDLRLAEDRERGKGQIPNDDSNVMPMYEEWVIYDAEERKFFGLSPGSEKLIREEQEWPFEWGQLPYSFLAFNRQLDTPFPVAFPRMFWDEQALYNDLWTIIKALVKRVRRVIFVREDGLKDGQADLLTNPDALVEFILTSANPKEVAHETQFGSIDNNLIGLLFQLKEQIREVLGVSSFDRAQRANVETAAEANQIGAGGALSRSRTQEKFEDFWTNGIRVSHRAFLQSENAREMILPIVGQENLNQLDESDRKRGFIEVNLESLQGEFQYAVKLDSTLRIDPAIRLARTATGFNLMGGFQSQILDQRYWHEQIAQDSGHDPQQALINEEQAKAMAQQAEAAEEGGEAPDAGVASTAQQGLPPINLTALNGGG